MPEQYLERHDLADRGAVRSDCRSALQAPARDECQACACLCMVEGRRTLSNRPEHHQCIHILPRDRKSTRLNSSHANISYAVFCLKKKKKKEYKKNFIIKKKLYINI